MLYIPTTASCYDLYDNFPHKGQNVCWWSHRHQQVGRVQYFVPWKHWWTIFLWLITALGYGVLTFYGWVKSDTEYLTILPASYGYGYSVTITIRFIVTLLWSLDFDCQQSKLVFEKSLATEMVYDFPLTLFLTFLFNMFWHFGLPAVLLFWGEMNVGNVTCLKIFTSF